MLENFQGDSWGSILPLRMPSLLPHDLCHGRSSSRWLPAVIEFQLSNYRSSLNMQYAGSRHLSFTLSWSLLRLVSIESVMPSSHLILCRPFLLLLSIFPSIRVFSSESALRIRWQSIRASALASVLPMNIQGWFLLGWTSLTPCSPRDFQESSTPQFKSIKSSVLSFLYGPTLRSIHDYWRNHRFD